ncbi:hypothetical protein OKJ48_04945 [Streptomyces kunmingensis]|uniref:Cupin n=1 Tax=Streptomyces kunmingensis TaxID=68225 RepID=A0ABU6C6Y6_9ACTN|nr:hypothetical protein [Streptomyces kunmingensis]MEB3959600.1 hypothetical protein [Streptomyces kunmingensis]
MSPVPAASVDVLESLDWDTFVDAYWDRGPVLIRGAALGVAPFDAHEVFESAVTAARRPSAGPVSFALGPRRLADPGDLLPQPEDGSFARYGRRLLRQSGREPFHLVVRGLHAFHHPVWLRARNFLAGLWDRTGQPLLGASTTLHHGTCGSERLSRTPGATFLYTLLGRPRLRLARAGRWLAARPAPGDLLYWPAGQRYVTESSRSPAGLVHLGVPRTAPGPGHGLRSLLAPGPNPAYPQARWGGDDILVQEDAEGVLDAGEADRAASELLPPVLVDALAHYREAARPTAMRRRLAREALLHATDGGLRPVPPPARPGRFTDDDAVRAVERVVWAETAGRRLVAACGHVLETDLTGAELSAIVGLLNAGEEVPVAELAPSARALMSRLAGFRAVERL